MTQRPKRWLCVPFRARVFHDDGGRPPLLMKMFSDVASRSPWLRLSQTPPAPCRNGPIAAPFQSHISIFPAGEHSPSPLSSFSYRPQLAMGENVDNITFLSLHPIANPVCLAPSVVRLHSCSFSTAVSVFSGLLHFHFDFGLLPLPSPFAFPQPSRNPDVWYRALRLHVTGCFGCARRTCKHRRPCKLTALAHYFSGASAPSVVLRVFRPPSLSPASRRLLPPPSHLDQQNAFASMTSRACSAKKLRATCMSIFQFLIVMCQKDGELLTHDAGDSPPPCRPRASCPSIGRRHSLLPQLWPFFLGHFCFDSILPRLLSPPSRLSLFPPSRPPRPVQTTSVGGKVHVSDALFRVRTS
jgi:hypothetical protein